MNRQGMISELEDRTGYPYEYLKSLPDEELKRLYEKRVVNHG